jgi:hydrogenase expression/formation protein HypE
MSDPLGKIPPDQFARLIAPHLGALRHEVAVGPGAGLDCAIVKLGAGRVMALTTDPLSLIPALGPAASARLSCHLLASDLWTSGIAPQFATVNFNLPQSVGEEAFADYWRAMSAEWESLLVAVVAGHTGRYPGGESTLLGAGTLIGIGEEHRYLTPALARPGDLVLLTKGCAIEATAVAAHLIPQRLRTHLGAGGVERARGLLDKVSVVADCRALIGAGVRRAPEQPESGVTALHDATEGGVLGGLLELARACGHDLSVERARIPLSPEARGACAALGGIDPYWTLAEGALIVTVRPGAVIGSLTALTDAGIAAAEIGAVVPGSGRLLLREPSGEVRTITDPEPDPYWPAYERAVREGWE